ncbi:GumC family protein [Oceanicoccus sagamiensis]|uniref:Lipopolysaccharide biosynthesis protein n=1 Tax=Oceanicoccus sagamiensis TaxID=716816 RepID=A0A1X9N7N2_9GAMM|nr:hypothetical protein [Oceanicoccus sagamiensis]ARN74080.1 hypothetical protein BST96_08070 [Oceanicoccus sagamiensis]
MNMAIDFEENSTSIGDYIAVLRRRKKQLLYPAAITFFIVLLVALLWPATYRSSATILIEEQSIPQDFVQSMITTFANQQIEIIRQRTMTLKNIMDLVDNYNLYDKDEMKRKTRTEIAGEFKDDVKVGLVNAQVIDPRSGRPTEATIAFTLSYEHGNASKAQKVANELVNLYLNENLKNRSEKAQGASEFLEAEAKSLEIVLVDLETKLAAFKQENEGSMPEAYVYNQSIIERTERELLEITSRKNELEKRRLSLSSDLAQASPYAPTVLSSGEQVLSDYDRLKSLKSEFTRKSALYSEEHPDISRLKREIAELEESMGGGLLPKDIAEQVRGEQVILDGLNQKYESDHPKVVAQQKIVDELSNQSSAESSVESTEVAPDNPSYVFLSTQLKTVEAEEKALIEKSEVLSNKISDYEERIARTPMVEQEYNNLKRNYRNAQAKYEEINAKKLGADVARNLEQDRKGQRFVLIEPPALPEEAASPKRVIIILVGFVLSGVVGLGFVLVAEAMDPGLRGEKAITDLTGVAPLVSVPYIFTEDEDKSSTRHMYYLFIGIILLGLLGLLGIHLFYKPIDVIWFILMRKFGLE